jgi:excisionase family DNA binding protein
MTPEDYAADQILTPRQVAHLFNVDCKTVSRWAKDGRIPSFRTLGGGPGMGHRRYRWSDVEPLLRFDGGTQ